MACILILYIAVVWMKVKEFIRGGSNLIDHLGCLLSKSRVQKKTCPISVCWDIHFFSIIFLYTISLSITSVYII